MQLYELMDAKLLHRDVYIAFISRDGSFGFDYPSKPEMFAVIQAMVSLGDLDKLRSLAPFVVVVEVRGGYIVVLSERKMELREEGVKEILADLHPLLDQEKVIKLFSVIERFAVL